MALCTLVVGCDGLFTFSLPDAPSSDVLHVVCTGVYLYNVCLSVCLCVSVSQYVSVCACVCMCMRVCMYGTMQKKVNEVCTRLHDIFSCG